MPDNDVPSFSGVALYALTPQGAALARTLVESFSCSLFLPERMCSEGERCFSSLAECVAENFTKFEGHIFIAATGIVVRTIAPLLESKATDPAVVVLDQKGQFSISLVSGHLGGANALATKIAGLVGATPVITTATDTENLPSLDMLAKRSGCTIHNLSAVKDVNGALLRKHPVLVDDPADILGLRESRWAAHFVFAEDMFMQEHEGPSVIVTWRSPELLDIAEDTLVLHPAVLHVGVGCKRGISQEQIVTFIRSVLARNTIAEESVASINSVDAKSDEQGLLGAAKQLRKPLRFFPAEILCEMDVPNPSVSPLQAVGTPSVAEAAALAAADNGHLVVEKQKGEGVTFAIALELP